MTMAEKILARDSGKAKMKTGQYVRAKVDWLQAVDDAESLYHGFKEIGIKKV